MLYQNYLHEVIKQCFKTNNLRVMLANWVSSSRLSYKGIGPVVKIEAVGPQWSHQEAK